MRHIADSRVELKPEKRLSLMSNTRKFDQISYFRRNGPAELIFRLNRVFLRLVKLAY